LQARIGCPTTSDLKVGNPSTGSGHFAEATVRSVWFYRLSSIKLLSRNLQDRLRRPELSRRVLPCGRTLGPKQPFRGFYFLVSFNYYLEIYRYITPTLSRKRARDIA
ncbi:MAG: hypothetical protein ACYC27_17500, partial [Armatimonadota bacterium]